MKKMQLVEMYKGKDAEKAALSVIRSGWYIKGPNQKEFQRKFARFCGVRDACALNSGTAALMLLAEILGAGRGDEVIMPSHTFIATAAPFINRGAKPVFVDVDPATHTIDPALVKKAVTDKTVGIVPVHLYGHPADMDPILELAARKGLWVVEDACQAHGALYKRRKIGSLGTAAAFSFFPSKNMTVGGDGGALVSNDVEIIEKANMLSDQGRMAGEKYLHHLCGYNFRMSEIQAGIGAVQLSHLPEWITARRRIAAMYDRELGKIPEVTVLKASKDVKNVYYVYTMMVPAQDRYPLQKHLGDKGIATGIYYPVPVHRQPAVARGRRPRRLPVTDKLVDEILSLPMHPGVTDAQVRKVAREVGAYFERKRK